jgi:alpha-L-fucosidase
MRHLFDLTCLLAKQVLSQLSSRGGNLLLDVGPQPDGQIQPEFVERLEAVGQWSPFQAEPAQWGARREA